jgi:hypothetical protein
MQEFLAAVIPRSEATRNLSVFDEDAADTLRVFEESLEDCRSLDETHWRKAEKHLWVLTKN